ncbi:MAG: hypothetical protein IKL94_03100 [Clostridia bacterium]|nr:hypothetical protein [Clostridia bacterium]
MKKKNLVAVWLSIALSLGVFAIAGLIFMPIAFNNEISPADNEQSGVPYPSDPQSSGILYVSEDGSGALIYLNFEQKTTTVNIFLEEAREKALLVGYEINYTLVGNDTFLCELCDRLGGIELDENGVKYRFTGAGLAKKLEKTHSVSQMAEISEGFFKKFSKIGLSDDDFKFIIENTRTDLNFPVCYSWREVISDTVSCYIFENVF